MKPKELYPYIEKKQPNICQISVLQNGQEIWAEAWNGYEKTDCTHIASATKSVFSLLIGIAIDNGLIGGVDDTVMSYFPDYRVKRGEKTIYDVTIKDLLGNPDFVYWNSDLLSRLAPGCFSSLYGRCSNLYFICWRIYRYCNRLA